MLRDRTRHVPEPQHHRPPIRLLTGATRAWGKPEVGRMFAEDAHRDGATGQAVRTLRAM